MSDNENCLLCMHDQYPFKLSDCEHSFCNWCILRMGIKSSMNCPLCKAQLFDKAKIEEHSVFYNKHNKVELQNLGIAVKIKEK
jgi:hypothetical protein